MTIFHDEIKRACLKRLQREWSCFNYWYLGRKLNPPTIEIEDVASRLGRWDSSTRTISIAAQHVLHDPWQAVLETLKHEMAHQYVDEALGLDRSLPHGEAFRRAEKLLATDEAIGAVRPDTVPADGEAAARLRKIRRLLALAESSNVNEAEAALAKANELLLKYNIDLAQAEKERRYCHRTLGTPTGRRSRYLMILAGLLSEHFFVEAIWIDSFEPRTGRSGNVLEIMGTPENVDLADYAYHELLRSGHELWKRHKRELAIGSDRDRRPYIEGVLTGFGHKLRAQREMHAKNNELVWLGDPGLDRFFRTRHPKLRTDSFYVSAGHEAFDAGRAAGAELRLTRAIRNQDGQSGRLITGG